MKKSKNIFLIALSVFLLMGGVTVPVQAQGGEVNVDIQSRQIDPGGSCTAHTTGGGCFTSSIVSGMILATHRNPTHTHNVTVANLIATSQSVWRAPSITGRAEASLSTTSFGNSSWWNIR
jgi:hypothetical protein